MKTPLVVVCGSTASGKTGLSIELAKKLGGEIVSADSMQIYRDMDIGTAKPDEEERQGIPHYMIDIVEPEDNFSVADFTDMAHKAIAEIQKRGRLPIVAGGTGLYINSLVDDVDFGSFETDEAYRKELMRFSQEHGAQALWEKLNACDPDAAQKIHFHNIKRVVRALEFHHSNGIRISQHQEYTRQIESRYEPIMLEIVWDRPVLYDRINRRVDMMMEQGLEEEVKRLIDRGCTQDMQSMKGIGYQEMLAFFNGKFSLEEAVEKIKQNSRRYAKRQVTWFKRDERIHRLKPGSDLVQRAQGIVREKLNKIC